MKNLVRIKGRMIDLRTDGGIEMVPPSVTEHGVYEWVGEGLRPVAELPVASIGWTRERVTRTIQPIEPPPALDPDRARLVRRAGGYIAHVEGAVSGRRGHDRTMRVAGLLIQKFGLTIPEAWPLFKEWNEACEPPWSDTELMHKLLDAEKNRK